MLSLKKSLRAKFTLVLFLVGLVPLGATSLFFYYTAKDALFKNVFKELKWNADEISGIVESHFSEAGKDLRIASENTAFKMYFLDNANKKMWVKEQQKTLAHLRSVYPDSIDEACFIESTGQEISRIVLDKLAHEHELSSDEDRSEFFRQAFLLNEDEVYQGRPMLSEDTKRWVIPNATPIVVNGKKAAILHFEVTMNYFQRLLKKLVNPDRGYGFILNDEGAFMAHTNMELGEREPFPQAITPETPAALASIFKRMLNNESGIEQFSTGGKDYYIIFKPVNTSYNRGRNDNRWTIGYVIPSERVYVELAILRYNIMALIFTALFIIVLAYTLGNYVTRPIRELARATRKVAGGELPKIEVKSNDEIGQLSESFKVMVEAVTRRDEALKALAVTDGLTGLYNHRFFKAELDRQVKGALRFARPVSLMMADVDYFKHYNDTNGHSLGDVALKSIAGILRRSTREVDVAARYGGEEFVVILPDTSIDGAMIAAERIRKKVEEENIPNRETQPGGKVTLSIGVATLPDNVMDAQALIEAADKALYQAKEAGRNRVVAARAEG
ncbi:MAG: diguanylate cyclase [Deltaproteobacteria bacterium]|nr:diguanylate cyclase [Deltaproteobacteria bacterium]